MIRVAQHDVETGAPPPPATGCACHNSASRYAALPSTGDIAPRQRHTGRHEREEQLPPDDPRLLARGLMFGVPLSALLWIVIIVFVQHFA